MQDGPLVLRVLYNIHSPIVQSGDIIDNNANASDEKTQIQMMP